MYATKMNAFAHVSVFTAFYAITFLFVFYQNFVFDLIEEFKEINFGLGKPEIAKDVLFASSSSSGFDEESCMSRSQIDAYRKVSPVKPSPYLLSKLRDYEDLHRHCAPYTESYNQSLKALQSPNISEPTDCKYIVWAANAGLGNRVLSITSAFLYAVLTNRTLLVENSPDMVDLFCEPFPDTSWLLPPDFPLIGEFKKINGKYPNIFQNLIKEFISNTTTTVSPPSFGYIYLAEGKDHIFYCEDQQKFVEKVPWLLLKTDEYFVPALFMISDFKEELDRIFPDKETVFHFLGRYLFNPSNTAWGIITRFYQTYLSKSDQRIGMQIRIFRPQGTSFKSLMDQILACSLQENLLPRIDHNKSIAFPSKNETLSKSILITSLYSEFFEEIKDKYWRFPTVSGELIGVYQLSHEGHQHFGDNMHNMKAWVEMNLLSFSDVLITSTMSTFGYVAQGFGGLKPWILELPEKWKTQNPACKLALSIEPCFHGPPLYDCKTKARVDMGNVVPHVKHCEDVHYGLKLFN